MFNTTQAMGLLNLTNKTHNKSRTKVVSITSGKGGVGKSTLSANIAYLYSLYGKKVVVLDADLGLANMQILFDIKPSKTFYDYIESGIELERVLLKTKYKDITLCAGKSGHKFVSSNSSFVYSRIIEDIVALNRYDILLVDTGAGLNEYVQEFLDISDEIVAITTTDPSALTDVYALIKMISNNKERLFLAFNQTPNYHVGSTITQSLKDLALKNKLNRKFMVQYVGNVVYDKNITTTGRLRKLFTKEFSNSVSSIDLNSIVSYLIKEIK